MQSVLSHIEKSIAENPDAVAVIHNQQIFTYRDLEEHANRLCHYLIDCNVQKGDKIALFMRRSFDLLVSVVAIWKLGAAYVPIDPEISINRMQSILDELKPRCVISEPALLNKIVDETQSIVTLKDPVCRTYSAIFKRQPVDDAEALAYLIYTSGSTGKPKGVMLTHANVMNHIVWLVRKFNLSASDRFSFNSSMAFDFSVACTLIPLCIGASIVITSEENTLNIAQYCQQLATHQVTFVKWTPSYFKLMIEHVAKHQPNFSTFRWVMLGGEELLTIYAKRWFEIYPNHTIINEYGPTEAAVGITTHIVMPSTIDETLHAIPIGEPAIHTDLYVVDSNNTLVKEGEVGELLIASISVGQGYYQQPQLTAERFIQNPFSALHKKVYKTGDLVKKLDDGSYFYQGRIDHQVKINGYRVELGEIEFHLLKYPKIKQAVVKVEKGFQGNATLIAYVALDENQSVDFARVHQFLVEKLPKFMLPRKYHIVTHVPLTKNGKVDGRNLDKFVVQQDINKVNVTPIFNPLVNLIADILKKYIKIDDIDFNASFFSLGVTSILLVQIVNDLNSKLNSILNLQDLFFYPTIEKLAIFLEKKEKTNNAYQSNNAISHQKERYNNEPIAIIAMDCKLPGANDCEELWRLCCEGNEGISFFEQTEHQQSSQFTEDLHPVYARGILSDIELFDADFFNFSAKEAHFSDPQHRLLLESAWRALEKAGYVSDSNSSHNIGVFVSMNDSTYLLNHDLLRLGEKYFNDRSIMLRLMSSQFLATKITYQLNCTGPSLTLQTACSSSLVAVALACQQLASYHCDMALAGGISITTPQDKPYYYQRGNIFSPDGHCRPFDNNAQGTVFSNGLGMIVLKRLSDALRDHDSIISIIKGNCFNNDGSQKMSYTAPSVSGQMKCILAAQESANIDINTIQYVEAHGAGTLIGDPIEVEVLTKAFRTKTLREQYCALGSLKGNIGHAHVAAGIAGLIKTSLMLQHQQIPPSIHCKQPNTNIEFERSPFYVNARLQDWSDTSFPRRAAVSALGVGGANAHVILEEAPKLEKASAKRPCYIILLSAKTPTALQQYHDKLIRFLEHADKNDRALLADTAYTLQRGRQYFSYRSGIVCTDINNAVTQLKQNKNNEMAPISSNALNLSQLVFLFPGQGTQYLNLSLLLYQKEPIFKKYLDQCLEEAQQYVDTNLKAILFPTQENLGEAQTKIHQTEYTHPILFSVEYALAQLLIYWELKPNTMLGHSLGEYTAACVAGVFSLADAIKLVCARGAAIAMCEAGAMLSVPLSEDAARSFCNDDINIGAINAPNNCVLSGSDSAITVVKNQLQSMEVDNAAMIRPLKGTYAFHSDQLTPAIEPFRAVLKTIKRSAPAIPYLSNLTGEWITESDVYSDDYWIDHMMKTVQFSRCAHHLVEYPNTVFVEVGPGRTLIALLQKHKKEGELQATTLLPHAKQYSQNSNNHCIENAIKTLWCYGYAIDWQKYYQDEIRYRIPLPTYPFQRKRYWFDEIIEADEKLEAAALHKSSSLFYAPTWMRDIEVTELVTESTFQGQPRQWVIFDDGSSCSEQVIQFLHLYNQPVIVIQIGNAFSQQDVNHFIINPRESEHYERVIQLIEMNETTHYAVVHFWSAQYEQLEINSNLLESESLYKSFYSGLYIAKAFYHIKPQAVIAMTMVTTELHSVLSNEKTDPLKSTVLGLCRVLPLENKNFQVCNIDIEHIVATDHIKHYAANIISKTANSFSEVALTNNVFALRNQYCWKLAYSDIKSLAKPSTSTIVDIESGAYLITGGLGGMGLQIAEWLSSKAAITVLLFSRTPFPNKQQWNEWLASHDEHDAVSQKIKKLQQIISNGCTVIIESADVANYQQLQQIVTKFEDHYGAIKGIFHLAGLPGEGLAILRKMTDIRTVLSPKVQGLAVLARLFADKVLNFVVSASSLTAIAGGVGQLDYCAANVFIDYFMAQRPFKKCKQHLTINWNAWSLVGMAAGGEYSKIHEKLYQDNSLTPDQAIVILERLLASSYSQVIISHFSPKNEVKRIVKIFDAVIKKPSGKTKNEISKKNNCSIYDVVNSIWSKVLGAQAINEKDTFYSLGGDSLLAIQMQLAIEQQFNVDISLQDLSYDHTLASLAQLIESKPIHSDHTIIPLLNTNNAISIKNKKHIYFIHPLGGTVLCYFSLKPYLKTDLPCYTVQDPEIANGQFLFESIKDMTLYYVEEIIKLQQVGEAILVGFSFGGNMAVEIAPHLQKQGINVEKIILIDSWANLGVAITKNVNKPREKETLQSLKMIREYYGLHSNQYQAIQKRMSWLRSYTPSDINVPTTLLKAKNILPVYQPIISEVHGWDQYCTRSIEQYIVPGTHDTIFKGQNLLGLGKVLGELIPVY